MFGIPIFIEVASTRQLADVRLCSKVTEQLMAQDVKPVALAGTVEETQAVLDEMRGYNLVPALFVINTFGAKDLLPLLDPLMEDLPVLYFRRSLYIGQSGLMSAMNPEEASSILGAEAALTRMKSRRTVMWYYGSKNADDMARRAAVALARFLENGDFCHIERASAIARAE